MGKQVDKYRGFSSAELKAKAGIPAKSDIVEYTNYIDCSNIKMSAVKTLLGASTWSLYDLCRHNNVNKWSGFSPYLKDVSNAGRNGTITFTKPSVCKLGDFAGYNHGAIPPSYISIDDYEKTTGSDGDNVTFQVEFNSTELILTDLNGALGIVLCAVWDGMTIPAYKVDALS